MGCDRRDNSLPTTGLDFNPRIPYGMRLSFPMMSCRSPAFQSTHPVWDATLPFWDGYARRFDFNPRIPYGMRLSEINQHAQYNLFQSTHPVWDATDAAVQTAMLSGISIHASRMGCDRPSTTPSPTSAHFNPRIPYGMRPVLVACIHVAVTISIHASRMGCDVERVPSALILEFQSTHPVWDATPRWPLGLLRRRISIHASRMGCDSIAVVNCDSISISIHASRMGCDGPSLRYATAQVQFQSTHPVWDAT